MDGETLLLQGGWKEGLKTRSAGASQLESCRISLLLLMLEGYAFCALL